MVTRTCSQHRAYLTVALTTSLVACAGTSPTGPAAPASLASNAPSSTSATSDTQIVGLQIDSRQRQWIPGTGTGGCYANGACTQLLLFQGAGNMKRTGDALSWFAGLPQVNWTIAGTLTSSRLVIDVVYVNGSSVRYEEHLEGTVMPDSQPRTFRVSGVSNGSSTTVTGVCRCAATWSGERFTGIITFVTGTGF
jgi:hypothetical protein